MTTSAVTPGEIVRRDDRAAITRTYTRFTAVSAIGFIAARETWTVAAAYLAVALVFTAGIAAAAGVAYLATFRGSAVNTWTVTMVLNIAVLTLTVIGDAHIVLVIVPLVGVAASGVLLSLACEALNDQDCAEAASAHREAQR